MKCKMLPLALGLALLAGCAPTAEEQMAKVTPGMSQPQVEQAIGKPEVVRTVRFQDHDDDYVVWQYQMVPPPGAWCPTEAASRVITGAATLGLSEIAWHNAKADAYWVFFYDGYMIYHAPAFPCDKDKICKFTDGKGTK